MSTESQRMEKPNLIVILVIVVATLIYAVILYYMPTIKSSFLSVAGGIGSTVGWLASITFIKELFADT